MNKTSAQQIRKLEMRIARLEKQAFTNKIKKKVLDFFNRVSPKIKKAFLGADKDLIEHYVREISKDPETVEALKNMPVRSGISKSWAYTKIVLKRFKPVATNLVSYIVAYMVGTYASTLLLGSAYGLMALKAGVIIAPILAVISFVIDELLREEGDEREHDLAREYAKQRLIDQRR